MTLKDKLKSKQLTIGSWLSFGYTPITEIMAKSGFEWLVIDMEHTPITEKDAMQMMQVISLAGGAPLVRVGKNDDLIIKRVMDSGAHGVIVPMVKTPQDAEKAVAAVKYPPIGNRGVGLYRAQDYGTGFEAYKTWVENESVVIVQIEHINAVERLPEIMAVDGVDGFIIGPYDMSASMGLPGCFDDPSVVYAMDSVVSFMQQSSKPGGIHIVHTSEKVLAEKIQEGYRFIAYGVDMLFFSEKVKTEQAIWQKLSQAEEI